MEPRAYKSGATGEPPEYPLTSQLGNPRSASAGLVATVPGPWWWYMNGEEGRNLILKGGIVPSPYDNTQMLQALRNIAGSAPTPPPPSGPASTLLLHFDSPTIVDSSGNNIVVNVAGSARYTTDTAKFGAGSLQISGNYDFLAVNDPRMQIGTNDFTISCWYKPSALSGQQFFLDCRTGGFRYNGLAFYTVNGFLSWFDGAINYGGTALLGGDWNHVELGRSAGTVYMFLDGNLVSTTPDINGSFQSQSWVIAAAQFTPPGVNANLGYTDEFLAVIGNCLHTESFTPPTAPYSN